MKIYINSRATAVPDRVVVEKGVVAVELSYFGNVLVWLTDLDRGEPVQELSCETTEATASGFRVKFKDEREVWIRIEREQLEILHYQRGKCIHKDTVPFITQPT